MEDNTPVSFGYKMGWLTIRSTDRDAVVETLRLADPTEATWKAGVEAVYRVFYQRFGRFSTVFVSPPVNGWTFVVGDWTMGTGEEQGVRAIQQLVSRASAAFGEAQAFATYRVIEYHHWMLAREGRLLRSFAYLGESGEVLADSGEPTPVELGFHWYPPSREDSDEGDEDPDAEEDLLPDEEAVMKVAGAWSINPDLLETLPASSLRGVLARAPSLREEPRYPAKGSDRRPWWHFW
jgi:hypothetical protein